MLFSKISCTFVETLLNIILITKVENITEIQTGLFAQPQSKGDVVYLQAKHFDSDGLLKIELHPDLYSNKISERHLLRSGDVLFAAKGYKNFATVYDSHNLPCVASTSFFVLRITSDKVLPEFLAWYLNHPQIMKVLKAQATGTAMTSISKAVLQKLDISLPALTKQKKIIAIDKLRKKEKELKSQKESLTEQLIQERLIQAINL